MFAACLPVLSYVEPPPPPQGDAINSVAGGKRCTHQAKQPRILCSIGNGVLTPCVVASSSNPEQATHHLVAEFVPMSIDEFVSLPSIAGAVACGHRRNPRNSTQDKNPRLSSARSETTVLERSP